MMIKFSVLILSILFLSTVINLLLSSAVGGFYRIFVAPGIVLHELSHAFFCFFTGAPVTNINFFKADGGEVKHGKSKLPIIGPILISVAPFVIGAAAIYFISKFIGFKGMDNSIYDFSFGGITKYINDVFHSLDLKKIKAVVALYLILSIAVTMVPSKQDIKNIFISLLVIGALVFLVWRYTNFRPNLEFLANPLFLSVLSTVVVILLFALILSIVVFVVASIFKT